MNYDTSDVMALMQFAWAAGVVDAEGVLRSHKGSLELRVRSTDRTMLDRLCDVLHGHVLGPYDNGVGVIFEWYLRPASLIPEALALMWPLLSQRQQDKWKIVLPDLQPVVLN